MIKDEIKKLCLNGLETQIKLLGQHVTPDKKEIRKNIKVLCRHAQAMEKIEKTRFRQPSSGKNFDDIKGGIIMELSKQKVLVFGLEGKEDLRFELFDWLKQKNLTVEEAEALLKLTSKEIMHASQKQKL